MIRRLATAAAAAAALTTAFPAAVAGQAFALGAPAFAGETCTGAGTTWAITGDTLTVTLPALTAAAGANRIRQRVRCRVSVPVTFVSTVTGLRVTHDAAHVIPPHGESTLRVTYAVRDDTLRRGPRYETTWRGHLPADGSEPTGTRDTVTLTHTLDRPPGLPDGTPVGVIVDLDLTVWTNDRGADATASLSKVTITKLP